MRSMSEIFMSCSQICMRLNTFFVTQVTQVQNVMRKTSFIVAEDSTRREGCSQTTVRRVSSALELYVWVEPVASLSLLIVGGADCKVVNFLDSQLCHFVVFLIKWVTNFPKDQTRYEF